MRVLVTGGTGFVGAHTTAALLAAGHEVRLLVRAPERIAAALRPLGITEPVDYVVGDITDQDSVERAVRGCDSVLHAAAVYSLDSRRYREVARTNLAGTGHVLRSAVEQGCDPVVHISSTVALLRRAATVTPDSPLSSVPGVYVGSKVESEAVARRWQEAGAPVVVVSPGAVLGPHDPHLGEQARVVRDVLRGLYPLWPTGGVHTVDVRDVAQVNTAVMMPGKGPRRYLVAGHFVDGRALFGTLREVTGRRLPYLVMPASGLLPVAWVASKVQRVLPFHLPAEYEGALIVKQRTRFDTSRTTEELGVGVRPLVDMYADVVRWLHQTGQLTARQAGTAAGPA